MEIYYAIIFFIFGTVFGSFYNVVGCRLPKNMSIIYPSSHCPKCKHKLSKLELIPIISYIYQKGKCKHCHRAISPFYIIIEIITGILFLLTYLSYGLNINIIIPLTFISILIIIIISDYKYMIINDEILIVFALILSIEILLIYNPTVLLIHILSGILAFLTMFGIKKLGDVLFQKESMGGGDIKLMFLFGLVLGYPMTILSIFLGSVIGLPISLITIKKNPKHIIPFGPLLAIGGMIIILAKIDYNFVLKILGI